eukprot:scaffold53_cov193-Pinguiococcus_pyrenoidosus.AAC.39
MPVPLPPCKTAAGRRLPPRAAQPSMFSLLSWPNPKSQSVSGAPKTDPSAPPEVPEATHFRMTSCKDDRELPPPPDVPPAAWESTYDADFHRMKLVNCPCTPSKAPKAQTSDRLSLAMDGEKAQWRTEYQTAFQDTSFLYQADGTAGDWVVVEDSKAVQQQMEAEDADEDATKHATSNEEAGIPFFVDNKKIPQYPILSVRQQESSPTLILSCAYVLLRLCALSPFCSYRSRRNPADKTHKQGRPEGEQEGTAGAARGQGGQI